MAGGHQLAHLMAQLQRVVSTGVAVMGAEPAQRAVPPHVVAAGGSIRRIEGEHRQQFDRCDAQITEVGEFVDQAAVAAPQLRGHAGIPPAGEAPQMQLVDHRLLPAVAGAGVGLQIEQVPFGHHPLQAGMGVGTRSGGQVALVDVPPRNGAGCGIKQHLGGLKTVAAGRSRAEDPIAVAASLPQTLHLHVPVVTGAVDQAVQFDHPRRRRGGAVDEQQQFDPVGGGGRHGKIHSPGGATAAQGPGASRMNAAQGHGAIELQTSGFVAF